MAVFRRIVCAGEHAKFGEFDPRCQVKVLKCPNNIFKIACLIFFSAQIILPGLKIRAGDTNLASHVDDKNALDLEILKSVLHPDYNEEVSYHDVAVLETVKITFSRSVSPVCLPDLPSDDIDKYKNYLVELTGWGQSHLHGETSDRLKRVTLKIFPLRY